MRRTFSIALTLTLASTLAVAQTPSSQPPPSQPSNPASKAPAPKPTGATGTTPGGTPTGTTGRAPGRATTTAPAKTTSVRVSVRNPKGESLDGVHLLLSGGADGEYSTAAAGTAVLTNVKDGLYRLRFEHDGFVTLEREFSVKATSALTTLDVVLTPAAPPPPPPPPPAPPAAVPPPSGPPVTVNIPDYLDRNFIGRDPIKESILACKPSETVRLLQLRENMARHVHDKTDEVLYVVAGEGAVRIGEETTTLKPGSLAVVPVGTAHAVERRGKTPLILISTLTGAACAANNKETQ